MRDAGCLHVRSARRKLNLKLRRSSWLQLKLSGGETEFAPDLPAVSFDHSPPDMVENVEIMKCWKKMARSDAEFSLRA